MSRMHGDFCWYELLTTDPAAAGTFYKKVVGWGSEDMPMPDGPYTLLKAGDIQVAGLMKLPQEACDAGARPFWAGYVHVDDVDVSTRAVQSAGGQTHRPPADIPGVGRFSVVTDPLGAVFDLYHPAQSGASPPAQPGTRGHVAWHELHTRDWPRALEFYGTLLGWKKGAAVDMGPMGTYQLFDVGSRSVGGMFNSEAAQARPFWLFYFVVGDIDDAAGRVTEAGGSIQHGPQQVPGGGWIVHAHDPQGALFALMGSRPA